jgi:hypothetical protein
MYKNFVNWKSLFLIIFLIGIIVVVTNIYFIYDNYCINNFSIKNSLIVFWDKYVKTAFLDVCKNSSMIFIDKLDIGYLYKIETNYIILMTKHPKNYHNINLLVSPLKEIIQHFHLTSIINIGSIGSNIFPVGTIVQTNKVVLQNPLQYSLHKNYIEGNRILMKTDKYTTMPGYISSQFQLPEEITNRYHIFGEDYFVILLVSNELNISNLCLGSVTDIVSKDGPKQYTENGQSCAFNTVKYLFNL